MPNPIRYTRQIKADHWVVQCKVCPRRLGRRNFQTEQAADDWWASHAETTAHIKSAAKDGSISNEERLLREIFGNGPAEERVPPNQRTGHVTSRPGHVRYHEQHNPRGATDDC